ncbi:hypothetical protein Tco_0365694 [Tanacetum coccineum]
MLPTVFLTLNEIYVPSLLQLSSLVPKTHDAEDCCIIDEDVLEEIDIRCASGYVTARIRSLCGDRENNNGEDIDWPKEFECEQAHALFGLDGLMVVDWKHESVLNAPRSLALMATRLREEDLMDYAIMDSGCSGSMTGDKDKLSDLKSSKGGLWTLGNDSQSIFDNEAQCSFTDKECVLSISPKFKFVVERLVTLLELLESMMLQTWDHNEYFSLRWQPITCLVAKATED